MKTSIKEWIKKDYIKSFGICFAIAFLSFIYFVVKNGGFFVLTNDFNDQQIPFTIGLHKSLLDGGISGFSWDVDLGTSTLDAYSFYEMGSPFFWLTLLFSEGAIPYIMAWVTALKYGVMAVTAYGFMKRHLRTETGAYLAAIMYAFTGYQGAVLVYNHFHDAVAFFPLFLCAFENLFRRRENGRRRVLGFVLMCTLMLVINYYFFVGQAVF